MEHLPQENLYGKQIWQYGGFWTNENAQIQNIVQVIVTELY